MKWKISQLCLTLWNPVDYKIIQLFWETMWQFLKKYIHIICPSHSTPTYLTRRNEIMCLLRDLYFNSHCSFTWNSPKLKTTKYLSRDERGNKFYHSHIMNYCSPKPRNKVLINQPCGWFQNKYAKQKKYKQNINKSKQNMLSKNRSNQKNYTYYAILICLKF